jgi:hypothetical protein
MRVESFSQVAHTGPARMTHSRRWALSTCEKFALHIIATCEQRKIQKFMQRLTNFNNFSHE